MHKIKLDPLPIVTGDPDELLDLDICDTCEFATTQAARIAAICEQVKRYTVTRYIAPGRQIIVAPAPAPRAAGRSRFTMPTVRPASWCPSATPTGTPPPELPTRFHTTTSPRMPWLNEKENEP